MGEVITNNIKPISLLITIIFSLISFSFWAGTSLAQAEQGKQDYRIKQLEMSVTAFKKETRKKFRKIEAKSWSKNDLKIFIQQGIEEILNKYGFAKTQSPTNK